ncbi:hypothetical protein XH83_33785 [Bradyrhizobium sp. CCBAU 53351]|uniref:helix-turn-helix domain-containing protein n=1 Tax=Bradyrhizobium sp. CCBAU 53351 TaxID=1325114 RepID=UPI001887E90D|nr:helix-turn-helix domain-containing protein [Bradyrhizobium sp. CCBAU 53351]QOZ79918.1 hypothetical protein XH83_33785 [Bradyrhizobium sp. CCBAU 53351]
MASIHHIKTDLLAVPQRDAARMLGISRAKIAEAVRSGALTVRKAPDGGLAARIAVTELLAWFETWPRKPVGRPRKPSKQKDQVNADQA